MNAIIQSPLRARAAASHGRLAASAFEIDLGVEPPIEADGERHSALDRRRVSLRWLFATILTGVAGAGLIGAAIYAALDGRMSFPQAPELAATRDTAAAADLVNPSKGDRLAKPVDIIAAKQTFRAPTTVTEGKSKVIRMRSFTRISTTLTMTSVGLADQVPVFNPLRLLVNSPAVNEQPIDPAQSPNDAEVSFETKNLAGLVIPLSAPSLTLEEAQAQISEFLRNKTAAGSKPPLPLPPQLLLMRTSRLGLDPAGGLGSPNSTDGIAGSPFSSIEVRMVPENVTLVPESPAPVATAALPMELLVPVRHGESLKDVLAQAGVPRDQSRGASAAFGLPRGRSPVSEGQRVKLQFINVDGTAQTRRLARLSVYTDETLEASIALDDAGQWTAVQKSPRAEAPESGPKGRFENSAPRMRLYDSFYETALKQGVPRRTIDHLVRIFADDVDFQAPVAGGDSFEALYENADAGRNELLYASITARNETYRFYRFRTPDNNRVDYYDENGRSSHKFLLRKPLLGGRLSSPFGMRFHPILGYTRMHTGVDWAAPIGTPILATGNGAIIKAGRESGYGNRIEIQHANGYVTTYNHLQGFARGIRVGAHVRQGQVIAFLGMTGLSTGPHIHYEVIVNGHFVDPERVKLARTRELAGKVLMQFKRARGRINKLLADAPDGTRVASQNG
ncbi:MAG TPA: M23 family metallopeptidase [Beijerinckiaceae bacterium]|nr:M23 family metallopeptidase [Beijerinckiaceae bacterium]HVB90348.1 M23 family metallopeptidase [Beijerinckiaceae bacterium]